VQKFETPIAAATSHAIIGENEGSSQYPPFSIAPNESPQNPFVSLSYRMEGNDNE